jgi:hypothetical protein
MRADYGNDLLAQEVVYQQFDDRVPEPVAPQAMLDAGGAITGITSKNAPDPQSVLIPLGTRRKTSRSL